jgi:hypothetical protein
MPAGRIAGIQHIAQGQELATPKRLEKIDLRAGHRTHAHLSAGKSHLAEFHAGHP